MSEYLALLDSRIRALRERNAVAEVYCSPCGSFVAVGNLHDGNDGSWWCPHCATGTEGLHIVRGPHHRALLIERNNGSANA